MPTSFAIQTSRTPMWDALFRAHPLSNAGEHPPGSRLDYTVVLLWVAATTLTLPIASPMRLTLAGFFTCSLFFYWRSMLPRLAANWPFLVLPVMELISATWSLNPPNTVRMAIMLAMTTVVCVFIAARLNRRQIIQAFFFVELIAGLWSMAITGSGPWAASGIFSHKNVLAIHMFFLFCSAMTIVLSRYERVALRLLAFVGVLVAVRMILLALSATTLAFMLIATVGFIFMHFVWVPARRTPHMRTLLAMVIGILGIMAVFLLFGILQLDAKETILAALGKDSTLTGRTMLWELANNVIADNPWTGLGPGGFWQPWRGEANTILREFHYKTFVGFNFHNSYLELGVMLGYPGMIGGYLVAGWATLNVIVRFFRKQDLIGYAFLVMGVMVVIRSNTEIDLAVEFAPTLVLMMIAAMVRVPGRQTAPVEYAPQPPPVMGPAPMMRPQP